MAKLVHPYVWVLFIIINVLCFSFSIISSDMTMAALNIFSALGSYVGYCLSTKG